MSSATRFCPGDRVTIVNARLPNFVWTVEGESEKDSKYYIYGEDYGYMWIAKEKLLPAPPQACSWCKMLE